MNKFKFGDKARVLKPHWHNESKIGVITSSENGLNTVHFNGGQFSCLIPDDYLTPVSAWIPCSERMPEQSGYYLVSVMDISSQDVYQSVSYCIAGCRFSSSFNERVTHWMPLPTPPQD
ncbi:DUF551 domain-containing protein [Vitreoscilla stercoraria]|uniref:DUF551 domain-containing protein n=1 Tax=Vitreoscilla stercoraria TaxID=61 RepID=A0ABY4EC93_VITST|nr:DUF551 domain-containing protein [Vitreoscilla stercoraria]UOO93346.1 DUF551 domain-containing protein [Vitreoscilla stercoraria]